MIIKNNWEKFKKTWGKKFNPGMPRPNKHEKFLRPNPWIDKPGLARSTGRFWPILQTSGKDQALFYHFNEIQKFDISITSSKGYSPDTKSDRQIKNIFPHSLHQNTRILRNTLKENSDRMWCIDKKKNCGSMHL